VNMIANAIPIAAKKDCRLSAAVVFDARKILTEYMGLCSLAISKIYSGQEIHTIAPPRQTHLDRTSCNEIDNEIKLHVRSA
jgi:hypothetical protein